MRDSGARTAPRFRPLWMSVFILCASDGFVSAEEFGLFTYRVVGGTVEITDYPTSEVGVVDIPAEIDGKQVISIGDGAFQNCSGLTSVSIPGSVTIGVAAFHNCTSLTSITIPNGVTSVARSAFDSCTSLTSITIPSSVTSIGDGAFRHCSTLSNALFFGDAPNSFGTGVFQNTAPGFTIQYLIGSARFTSPTWKGYPATIYSSLFTFRVGDSVEITDYPTTETGDVDIPAEIEGVPVTNIGNDAFRDCTGLTSITIPSSVTSIGDNAFRDCRKLASITIPERITSIGSYSFSGCRRLFNVTIPSSVTEISTGLFENSGLTNISMTEGLTTIGFHAFSGCIGLTSITIPLGVTSIGDYSFSGCSGLVSITIPEGVTEIYDRAFQSCVGLTSVSIPESVIELGSYAFFDCSGLTAITIPAGVAIIGTSAFDGCIELTKAVFMGNAPSLFYASVFDNTAPDFTIYFLRSRIGFTSPTWRGYPATEIDVAGFPAAPWLLVYGFAHDTDLNQDTNGDGVSLLMAYALNLDPNLNLRRSLPMPVLGDDSLSISFYAASPGITYTVEASADLRTWATEGVTLSALDPDGQRTASVALDSPSRFLRLVVED